MTPVVTASPHKKFQSIRSSTDFARYVGLARTTVSRVLNGQPGLKQKTIDRVQQAIQETGFVPNAHALHLKGKRTASVGICMETLSTPPMVQKLAGLQRRLREKNFSSLIEVMDPGNSRKVVRHFLAMRVDAVVFIGHFDEAQLAERLEELNANETPHLVIDHFGIKEANTVSLDRASGLASVMEMLLAQGHRTFGLLAFSGQIRGTLDRVRGVRETLASRGLDFKRCVFSLDHLFVRENDFEYGRMIAKSFVKHGELPSALIGLNDAIAIGAMHGLQEEGVAVPADVSVVGFNNQDICLMSTPSLTSVDQRVDHTVNVAAEFILSQIGQTWSRGRPAIHLIDPLLVIRESTGPVRR